MNAEQLYEAFVKDNPTQDEAAWSQLLQQHPQEAVRLQELRRQHQEWQAVIVDLKPSQVQQRLNSNVATESKTVSQWIERLRSQASSAARYEVEEEIGRGGMGVVSRVWDGGLQRTLAMKQIRSQPESPENSPVILRRFLEEAQITGQLDHPGIVPVHELGLGADGRLFFTMRLVHGENLRTIFEHVHAGREGWTLPRALGVILKVCEAMSYAHDKGVLHRDLKPSNIMVGRYGEVYVMDWGLARVMNQRDTHDLRWSEASMEGSDGGDSLVTRDGDIIGTPSYMSPEQALSDTESVGPHSDVYSVGAMLYHLLGVKKYSAPYSPRGANVTAREVLNALRASAPEPLRDAPAELVAITEKAMARDISLRYRDMQSFASDLRAFLEGRVVQAYETGTWAEMRKWCARNRSLTAALSGGILALTGGLIFSVYFATESKASEQKALNANSVLDHQNKILQEANRDARLRAVIQELNRFREETGDRDALQALPESTASWWLARAKRLVSGVAAQPGHPETWVPGLADVDSKLVELRADPSVGPYGAAEALLDFDTHPERGRITELELELAQVRPVTLADLESRALKIQWMACMLGEQTWPDAAGVRVELEAALRESDWEKLRKEAFACVENNNGRIYGQEVKALLLMERALEVAPSEAQAPCTFSLAMIRAYNGQTANALATAVSMLDSFVGNEPPWLANGIKQVRNYVDEWTGESRSQLRKEWYQLKADQQRDEANLDAIIAEKELPVQRRLQSLRAECSRRRTWTFPSSDQQWWHDTLTATVERLRHLAANVLAAELSLQTEQAKARWSTALDSIAKSPRYSGCRWPNGVLLTPQLGLLPLGENPVTGLWEFVHTQSGMEPGLDANGVPVRDEFGRLSLSAKTGIILVLIPGGSIALDTPFPGTSLFPEDPTTVIQLDPYFLARHELTQEQWDRLSGKPWWHAAALGDMKPVTMVSWQDAEELWPETLGWLTLPSGAQWEFACRAGSTTLWWTGADALSLQGVENVRFPNTPLVPLRAAGEGRPNPFGMHDMHGNVWEWCADAFPLEYEMPVLKYRQGDGLRSRKLSAHRQFRGGSHGYGPDLARSGFGSSLTFTHRVGDLGLRVMRPVMP